VANDLINYRHRVLKISKLMPVWHLGCKMYNITTTVSQATKNEDLNLKNKKIKFPFFLQAYGKHIHH